MNFSEYLIPFPVRKVARPRCFSCKTYIEFRTAFPACKESRTSKEIILKEDRNLFAQMILITKNRKLQMNEVSSHSLGPLPWALSTADESLRKTNKAALKKELQRRLPFADVIPQASACMIDACPWYRDSKETTRRLPR